MAGSLNPKWNIGKYWNTITGQKWVELLSAVQCVQPVQENLCSTSSHLAFLSQSPEYLPQHGTFTLGNAQSQSHRQ
jgi:hypothetical protein